MSQWTNTNQIQTPPSPSLPCSSELLPGDWKNRARFIVQKSKDPQRSFSIFRSRAHAIISGNPSATQPQSASLSPPSPQSSSLGRPSLHDWEDADREDAGRVGAACPRFVAQSVAPRMGDTLGAAINQKIKSPPTEKNESQSPLSLKKIDEGAEYLLTDLHRLVTANSALIPRSNQRIQDDGGQNINQGNLIDPGTNLSITTPCFPRAPLCIFMEPIIKGAGNEMTKRATTLQTRDQPPLRTGHHMASIVGGVGEGQSWRRSGKELMMELGTEEERKPIRLNIASAKGAMRGRFLAVGIFLSMIAINSKHLVDSLKKIWRARGNIDTNPLPDRRFVIEFSVEGDYNHVTRGGPWRYHGDAVIVKALKEGEDPTAVVFESVPIWVQFRDIPYYLLSKDLARRLGKKLGALISINNNSRGDINKKIIRAKIHLPIDRALQRWIPLEDEIKNEEDIVVVVFYERLPNFCLYCGFVGHKEAECSLDDDMKITRYRPELAVPPTGYEDPRWFLPETTGQEHHYQSQALPWRTQVSHASTRQQAMVAVVAKEVEKLTMQEKEPEEEQSKKENSSTASVASKPVPAATREGALEVIVTAVYDDMPPKKGKCWRRRAREEEEVQSNQESSLKYTSLSDGALAGDNALIRHLRAEAKQGLEGQMLIIHGTALGKRTNMNHHEMDDDESNASFEVIVSNKRPRSVALTELLNYRNGKEEGEAMKGTAATHSGKEEPAARKEDDAEQEATSPGAAGHLAARRSAPARSHDDHVLELSGAGRPPDSSGANPPRASKPSKTGVPM